MKKLFYLIVVLLVSCNTQTATKQADLSDKAMTADDQKSLSPDSIISILKVGNMHFYGHKLSPKNDSLRMHQTANGQYPKAAILACIDSRVPVENVFDQGIGDLFVARVAGNIVDPSILGSLEYSCFEAGAKVIMVLGHEHCGAVKAAVEDVRAGNITALLANIKPAIDSTKTDGPRTDKNDAFLHDVAVENVKLTIKKIRTDSPILNKMEQEKKIMIIGGIYDIDSGKITFF
ncbi:MAG TPA: carbonic anhydrase family protein [Mucilaginibacter sp.]|jgi:carbonic anhydrase